MPRHRQQTLANHKEAIMSGKLKHLAISSENYAALARFYQAAFGMTASPTNRPEGAVSLSDGRITLVITPWQIGDYTGGNVEAPGPDHIGFAVESLEQFEADVEHIKLRNPCLHPMQLGYGPEGESRLRLFQPC